MSIRTLGTATDVRPCVNCKPGHIALAASPEASDNWAAEVSCAAFAAGTVLYARGSTSRHIFGICDGLVKLVMPVANGGQRIVRLAREGDVIGLEGLADNTYHSSASAITSVRSYVIPAQRIKRWDRDVPRFHEILLCLLLRGQDHADRIIAELATGKAKARMARLIFDFLAYENMGGACLCHAPSREDMAAILGVTTETASRIIAGLKRQRLIGSESSYCFPCKIDELKKLADGE